MITGIILFPTKTRSQNYWVSNIDQVEEINNTPVKTCLLYTSPSPRDGLLSRMPSSA